MKLIVAYIKPFKLEEVKSALTDVGISGMTTVDVEGFGRQSGQTEVYRGAEYEVDFVPKVRIEVLASDELVNPAIEAIEAAAKTGEIGDGKIAVVPVEAAVRIRTGERGSDAV